MTAHGTQNHKDQDYAYSSLYATSVFMVDSCGLAQRILVNIKIRFSLETMPQMRDLCILMSNIVWILFLSCFQTRVRASNNQCFNEIQIILCLTFCSLQCIVLSFFVFSASEHRIGLTEQLKVCIILCFYSDLLRYYGLLSSHQIDVKGLL